MAFGGNKEVGAIEREEIITIAWKIGFWISAS